MDIETLAQQNASLNEQVKLLARVEKRLYSTQNSLALQLQRIRALSDFALVAMHAASPVEILTQAIELLCPLYAVQAVVAVLYAGPGSEPAALTWLIDGEVTRTAAPSSLATMPADEVTNRSTLVAERARDARDAPGAPVAPIVAWLDDVSRDVEGDWKRYIWRDVVLTIGSDSKAAFAILAFRSASMTNFLTVAGEADLPFLEVVCRHVSRNMEMAMLHASLEHRVEERTLALRDTNAQLAESLERLRSTQRQLVEASRRAGMSDVATSVLHNVGNVLNSVNVSASLVAEQVSNANAKRITRVAELVRQHRDDLPGFFAEDSPGAGLSGYLDALASAIDTDNEQMLGELASLRKNVDHIRAIIVRQQDFAKAPNSVAEQVSLIDVVEDALRFEQPSYQRYGITVERQFAPLTAVLCDRHKILQILTNLVSNARHAVSQQPVERRRVIVRAHRIGNDHVIEVEDAGCGIPQDNLDRVFSLGFTTRADGHGFGLHSSACSAAEIGGQLTCHSDGADRGALFRLTVPLSEANC